MTVLNHTVSLAYFWFRRLAHRVGVYQNELDNAEATAKLLVDRAKPIDSRYIKKAFLEAFQCIAALHRVLNDK